MSIRKGSRTIASSVPVTEWGSVDGTLSNQADLKSALDSKAPTYSPTFTGMPLAPTPAVDTNNNQIATTKFVKDSLLNVEATLPEQTGNSGKFLSTDGYITSWTSITGLPAQTSQSGKFLTTNGTAASWGDAVTIDTAQTITGNKTIENSNVTSSTVDGTSFTIKSNNQHLGTNPSSNHISSINFTDDSNATVAKFSSIQTSDGWSGFLAGAGSDPTNPHNNMLMIANGNNKLLLVPPTSNHNSCAVRKDFFDTEFGKTVKNTGDETIAGTKTFTDRPIVMTGSSDSRYISKLSTYELGGTVPQDNTAGGVLVRDKNNAEIGNFFAGITTSGTTRSGIFIKQPASSNPASNQIYIECDSNGVFTTYAPSPSSVTDNTKKIATTEWVVDVLKAIYPVGSLYIGTQNSCPLSAFFGTWTLVSAGNALWTGNGTSGSGTTANANYANAAANTTIAAGLPDATHNHIDGFAGVNANSSYGVTNTTVAGNINTQNGTSYNYHAITSSTSLSTANSIYGSSSTVQPPAFVVNVWRRTA